MAVEEIELRLTVDGRPAQKALDETRKAAESMGGRVGNLTEAFKNLQQKLGPSAAAISGVASALGQTNGEAGKALAAVGQVAAAFAAGGKFGAALAAGTFAVDALSRSWEQQIAAQDNALAGIYRATDGYIKNLQTARGELQKARGELATAARGGRELTAEERKQQLRDEAAGRIAAAEAAAKQARAAVDLAKAQATAEEFGTTFSQERLLMEQVRATNIRLADKALEQERQALQTRINAISVSEIMRKKAEEERAQNEFLADSIADIAAQRRAAATAARDPGMDPLQARIVAGMAAQEQARAAADEAFEADIDRMAAEGAARLSFEQLKSSILADAEEERTELARKAAEERARIAQDEQKATIDAVTGGLGVVVGAFQGYVDARIKGEEDAEAAFISSITKQAGQALISYGTQAIGRGILEASSPVTAALAPASFAAGAGLVAGGIALGGVATGIMHVAQGGTVGQPVPQSTSGRATDPGARARPSSGARSSSGGGTNVTIIYGGISGPSADDGARALRKAATRADRRGFA